MSFLHNLTRIKVAIVIQERMPTVEMVIRAATQASDLSVTPVKQEVFKNT